MPFAEWAGILLMAVPGVNSLVYGVLFLWAPQRLQHQTASGAKPQRWDVLFLAHHTSTGLCLVAGGLFCLASALYVWLRLNS